MKKHTKILRESPPLQICVDYYFAQAWCSNCEERNFCYVLKGTLRKGLTIICDKCGCDVPL